MKAIIIAAQAFLPTASQSAALYGISAGAFALPPSFTPSLSGYLSSKFAQVKVFEFLAAENPELFVCSVHPGMIDTGIFRSSGADKEKLPMDTCKSDVPENEIYAILIRETVKLPAHFLVWLTQPRTKFLNGRMVWANWDVDELCEKEKEIQTSSMLTLGYQGWPEFK